MATTKQRVNYNIEKEQEDALSEVSYQTGFAKSEIIRRLFRYLPQLRQELIEEARKRLSNV